MQPTASASLKARALSHPNLIFTPSSHLTDKAPFTRHSPSEITSPRTAGKHNQGSRLKADVFSFIRLIWALLGLSAGRGCRIAHLLAFELGKHGCVGCVAEWGREEDGDAFMAFETSSGCEEGILDSRNSPGSSFSPSQTEITRFPPSQSPASSSSATKAHHPAFEA